MQSVMQRSTIVLPPAPLPSAGRLAVGSGFVAAALLTGVVAGLHPALAFGACAGAGVVALAFLAPVTHLTLLMLVSAIVPFGLQNRFGAGGSLIPSDVLLLSGLLATAVRLPRTAMSLRALGAATAIVVFVVLVALQGIRGLQDGSSISQVGFEFRVLLSFATLLIALPILAQPASRRRLLTGLLVAGIVLGLWGMAQWFLNIPEINESGIGVRGGVQGTSDGRGSLQGGLYAYPVAVVIAFAALLSGRLPTQRVRLLVGGVLALNLVSLLLTYERTFWAAAILGMGFVVVHAGRGRRLRALLALGITGIALLSLFATVAPHELTTARERLMSVGQYGSDDSVRIRLLETEHAMVQVREHPWSGNGLGATIFIGRPWQGVPPTSEWYIHNGYVWLVWRLGLAVTLLLLALLTWAVCARARASEDPPFDAVRTGARASLMVLLLSSVTFPTFNGLEITATMGVLAAFALVPVRARRAATTTP